MITVVIAVGDAGRGQNYRRLLAQTGFDGHFAADLGILSRIVKSRPVDVVIYDVSPKFIPATEWLDMMDKDPDLGLTPVLWVGSGIVPSLARRLDAHRPGARLARLADAPTLVEVVDRLIGRSRSATARSGASNPEDMPENWVPPDDTIDDALSIFSENSNIPIGGEAESIPASPGPVSNQGAVPNKASAPSSMNTTATSFRPVIVPRTPEEVEADEKLQVDVMRTGNHPARLNNTGAQKPLMAGEASGSEQSSGPVFSELRPVEDIISAVARRVADHIVQNLDRDLIRREVERVLEQRKPPAKT